MKWHKKKIANADLVQNMMISRWSFSYLLEQRRNNQEAFHKVLDRVLKEHENLAKDTFE